jgi:hypothetical protein
MMAQIKAVLKGAFPVQYTGVLVYRYLVKQKQSYLQSTGWIRSLQAGIPVSASGEPVPWMNYAVVDLLASRIPADAVMFEYGSGYSTLFWARRAARVIAVEYDQAWYEKVRELLPANAELRFCPADRDRDYCRQIGLAGIPVDIVVVDGRDRVNCVRQSLPYLSSRGIVVLDDSDRKRYGEAFTVLAGSGFSHLSLRGMKPTHFEASQTTIFYRAGNCLAV